MLVRSTDNGVTWSKPVKLANCDPSAHGPIVTKDGALLQIGRRIADPDPDAVSKNKVGLSVLSVSRSTDGGQTWTYVCPEIPLTKQENDAPGRFHDPHLAELPDGSLVAVVRYDCVGTTGKYLHHEHGLMRVARSTDGGKTWTPFAETPMLGFPPHLLTLPDGKLICTYARRVGRSSVWNPAHGIYATLSTDGGKTWDGANEIQLLPTVPIYQMGSPASCVLSNGDILTVYYTLALKSVEKEKTWLMTTRWRVK